MFRRPFIFFLLNRIFLRHLFPNGTLEGNNSPNGSYQCNFPNISISHISPLHFQSLPLDTSCSTNSKHWMDFLLGSYLIYIASSFLYEHHISMNHFPLLFICHFHIHYFIPIEYISFEPRTQSPSHKCYVISIFVFIGTTFMNPIHTSSSSLSWQDFTEQIFSVGNEFLNLIFSFLSYW